MSVHYEFERREPGSTRWDRSKFRYWPQHFGDKDPTDERMAAEMLVIQSQRYREGTSFRLVRIEETLVGEEVESPTDASKST